MTRLDPVHHKKSLSEDAVVTIPLLLLLQILVRSSAAFGGKGGVTTFVDFQIVVVGWNIKT